MSSKQSINSQQTVYSYSFFALYDSIVIGIPYRLIKGMKSASSLFLLDGFNPVAGTVIDCMHCVLLGVTKTLIHRWIDAESRGMPYYIGDEVHSDYNFKCPRSLWMHLSFILIQ